MNDNEEKSRRRLAVPLALLLGSAAFAAPVAAQAASVETTFAGSNCHTGTYIANSFEIFSLGLGEAPSTQELFCPIPRLHPTWPNLQVSVYFYDTSSPDGTSSGSASCTLSTWNANDTTSNSSSGSVATIDPEEPLFLSTVLTPVAGESLWNSFTSATPMWRQARLLCDGVPATANLVTYDVWESQQ